MRKEINLTQRDIEQYESLHREYQSIYEQILTNACYRAIPNSERSRLRNANYNFSMAYQSVQELKECINGTDKM